MKRRALRRLGPPGEDGAKKAPRGLGGAGCPGKGKPRVHSTLPAPPPHLHRTLGPRTGLDGRFSGAAIGEAKGLRKQRAAPPQRGPGAVGEEIRNPGDRRGLGSVTRARTLSCTATSAVLSRAAQLRAQSPAHQEPRGRGAGPVCARALRGGTTQALAKGL